jgi:LysM repeat protein
MADTWITIQKGDSLTAIAEKYDVTVSRIMRANPWIINANYIKIGMPLRIPSKMQNPKVTSLYGGAKDLKNGGTQLLVEFELAEPAGADGWIVQQVDHSYDIRKPDGSVANPRIQGSRPTYWEAWPVKAGDTKTSNRNDPTSEGVTYDESFDQPDRSGTKGSFTVRAVVRFYELAALPVEFKKQNPLTRGEDLPSSATKPAFWDGTGTIRDFEADWDATSGTCTTQTFNFVRGAE